MLKREDILSLGYLKKTQFKGSYRGMRFQLQKETQEEEQGLRVYAWPEPFAYDCTDEDKKRSRALPFNEEGIVQAVEWLNEVYGEIVKE